MQRSVNISDCGWPHPPGQGGTWHFPSPENKLSPASRPLHDCGKLCYAFLRNNCCFDFCRFCLELWLLLPWIVLGVTLNYDRCCHYGSLPLWESTSSVSPTLRCQVFWAPQTWCMMNLIYKARTKITTTKRTWSEQSFPAIQEACALWASPRQWCQTSRWCCLLTMSGSERKSESGRGIMSTNLGCQ